MVLRIHQRLTLIYSLVFAVIFFGVYLYLHSTLTADSYHQIERNLARDLAFSRLYIEGAASDKELSLSDWALLADRIGKILKLRVTIIAREGAVWGDSAVLREELKTIENHLQRPEVQKALKTGLGEERRFSDTIKKEMLYMAMPFSTGRMQGFIRLAIPLTDIEGLAGRLNWLLVLSLFVAFSMSILLSLVASTYFSRPLKELASIAQKIAAGDFSQRVFMPRKDELSDLANSFNFMSEQVRQRIDEVAKEKSRLEAVLLSMFEGICVVDTKGNILVMNETFRNLFHVHDVPVGKNTIEVIRNIKAQEIIDKVLKRPEGVESEEIAILLPEEKVVSVHAAPILREKQLEGVVVVFHDITELRKMERIRREFVANVSHELRTPLASIKGYAETLLDGALEDKENAADFLRIIHTDADRLARLIKDILDLSKIESGTLKLNLKAMAVKSVVDRVLQGLHQQMKEKSLLVSNEIPNTQPLILADEDRIAQVLLNLIDNAIKCTPSQGKITISAQPQEKVLQINVSDTGIGIPSEDLPRIFERFYRVDKARSREMGGTGLGLSIVKHLVLAHNGHVWVNSDLGRGTTFSFSIPLA